MKRSKLIGLSMFIIILMLDFKPAFGNVFGYKLENGIDVINCWNHSTANNIIYNLNQAKSNWEYPGWYNPIDFVMYSSNDSTNMDFWSYPSSYFESGVLAYTDFYQTGYRAVDPSSEDWFWCKISVNYEDPGTNTQKTGTIIHEIGHGMGLAHRNSSPDSSIMCQRAYGRTVNTVQYSDNLNLLNLYGY